MKIYKMAFEDLGVETQKFLRNLNRNVPDSSDDSKIPIYFREKESGVVFFIKDFPLKFSANKSFEKGAHEFGLYRGGAVVILKTNLKYKVSDSLVSREVLIVVSDERYLVGKPVAGIADFKEGTDLFETAYRELAEELFVFTLDKENPMRIVPKGMKDAFTTNVLNINISGLIEVGELIVHDYYFNEKNRAFELHTLWDIAYQGKFSCVHNEDWFQGGNSGFVIYVIDTRTQGRVGVFSGRQGFVPLAEYALHPSLLRYLSDQY